ncbi:ankyrin repeat domain-containing protein [Wolbachia pipientis]|uniref:ankyrin repeat domain-containing protein n=1 Tax=Wolbachia pipientis TaxID=955 RepID=UPI0016513979|nr:ankyrin repeat domain-containing protein [Wolbachia pipientis]MBC6685680.1 ankyrin repeat domain-containing protein [Wolbachia pipientis]
MFLLQTGADPNVQNQAGKTLLHYVAERNDIDGIKFFFEAGADLNVRDLSGKIPSDYATKHCLQVLKDCGYDLGDSHENEGNPATPDGSVGESNDCSNSSGDDSQVKSVKLSDCNTEEDSDYHSDSSCENEENPANNSSNYPNKHNDDQALCDDPGYGSGDDNKTISTEPSGYLFLEDSLLAKLGIPLTTDEQKLIDKFCEEIRGITTQNKQESEESILKGIEKIVNEYLEKGLRLNSSCSNDNEKGDKETVTNLILEEIEGIINDRVKPRDGTKAYIGRVNDITDQDDDSKDKASGIIGNITSWLLLKGGKARQKFFFGNTELAQDYGFHYMNDLNKQYKDRKEELKSIACEGIVNKSKQTHEYDFKAEIDNVYFYVKYPQDSIIEPVKILNNEKAKKLNLKVGILQIGESIVRVEGTKDGKRNYTDVLEGSIKMSFTTEVGEISIYLSPSKKDGNKIKVEIDEENKAKFNKLKDKSSLGKDCLLEGENVSEVISKNFKMSDSVSTESIETIKDVPFTGFTQACSQQINTSVKGR